MLGLQLIEEIMDAWVNIGRATNKPEMVAAVPDPLDLKILFETIYFASIEYEEGVRVKVRVVLFTRLDQVQSFLGRPPALIMNVVSPGSVAIAYADRVVGRFEKGQFA
jgi:hypothetical protein